MMNLRMVGVGLMSVTVLSACATKGFVRSSVEEQRQALAQERSERIAGDEALRGEISGLRTELQTMRTEFGAKITALEEGMRFAFPVNFAFDDANVRPEDQAALDKFAEVAAKYYPNSHITIEGFADPAGSASYNRQLSERRAQSVRDYLATKGLDANMLRTIGYGESRQVVQGAQRDDAGAEKNRRVVFVIETKGDATAPVVSQATF
ncbi:MAG TPA: OmpA family protein [Gemmatimonadaceae bacterium]|nr:OmpA family protein [Gemmatimonadaceae bacterium]